MLDPKVSLSLYLGNCPTGAEETRVNDVGLDEKICLVTGASSGVGEAVALELARSGARVILVCRSAVRGRVSLEKIAEAAPGAQVDLIIADLSLMSEVRRVAQEFQSKYRRLDVLVNNAGAMIPERTLTDEGHETTWALNYLAPVLLTELLLGVLGQGPEGRVINVASNAEALQPLDLDDVTFAQGYSFPTAYGRAKLALVMHTYDLAHRLGEGSVTVNAIHPGLVRSRFSEGSKGVLRVVGHLLYWIAGIPASQAAKSVLRLALSPELRGQSGKYFLETKEARSSPRSYDLAQRTRLDQLTRRSLCLEAGTN